MIEYYHLPMEADFFTRPIIWFDDDDDFARMRRLYVVEFFRTKVRTAAERNLFLVVFIDLFWMVWCLSRVVCVLSIESSSFIITLWLKWFCCLSHHGVGLEVVWLPSKQWSTCKTQKSIDGRRMSKHIPRGIGTTNRRNYTFSSPK